MIWYLYHYWIVFKAQAPSMLWDLWEWWYKLVSSWPLASMMILQFCILFLLSMHIARSVTIIKVEKEKIQILSGLLQNGEAHQKTDKSEE